MSAGDPNFSPFPFERLRRVTRREAALESAIARWLAARPPGAPGERLARLVGGRVRVRVVGRTGGGLDPHAAVAEVRGGGSSIVVAAASAPVRALAQRLLGGPDELAAPRPLALAEQAIWALAVAAALEDAGIAALVWPLPGPPPEPDGPRIELAVELPAGPLAVVACFPPDLELRAPPPRARASWSIALPVVVGRCAIPRAAARALGLRDVVTLEGGLELAIGDGGVGLRADPAAMAAEVATGYVRRAMAGSAVSDEAHLELTVQLGTTRLPVRRLAELAIGEVIPLGRPLAGPYEVRVAGQLVGQGELLDVDGELGVRIVSLIRQE